MHAAKAFSLKFMVIATLLNMSCISSQGMEEQPTHEPVNLSNDHQNNLPKGYQHKNVQAQIADYRKIYKHLPKNVQSSQHIEGLFEILKRGFALVNDYITESNGKPGNVEIAFKRLKTLYDMTVHLNQHQKMNSFNFITINFYLALIVDDFKNVPLKQKVNLDNLSLEAIEKKGYGTFLGTHHYLNPLESGSVPMIIYTNIGSKTRIGYTTFVDQRLNEMPRGDIALFDVKSVPFSITYPSSTKIGTKKDPHYSRFNGTFNMLRHDFQHHVEQFDLEEFLESTINSYGINWSDHLIKINNLRNKLKEGKGTQNNEYRLLTNALFLLSHEFFNLLSYSGERAENIINKNYNRNYKRLPDSADFIDIIRYIQKIMVQNIQSEKRVVFPPLPHIGLAQTGYKTDKRDHEYALKGIVDLNRFALMPENFSQLSATAKQKAVADGYQRFWDAFCDILQSHLPNDYGKVIHDGYYGEEDDFAEILK